MPRFIVLFLLSCVYLIGGGLIGRWEFEEGTGRRSADLSGRDRPARLLGACWAQGEFGGAVKLGYQGMKTTVEIPCLNELDGTNEMTMSLWAMFDEHSESYPCLLSAGWSPGGIMFFKNGSSASVRFGKPKAAHWIKEDKWTETQVHLASNLPLKKWVHFAVTFKRPTITTYFNGKKVATNTNWDYELGITKPLTLGSVHFSRTSHNGLIDDMRVYDYALSAEEIAKLHQDSLREQVEYKINASDVKGKTILKLENKHAVLELCDDGTIGELQEKATKRNLVKQIIPMVKIELLNQTNQGYIWESDNFTLEPNGLVTCTFPTGHVRLKVTDCQEYFKIELAEITVPDVRHCWFARIQPACDAYFGAMAGMRSDDQSAVCLRSLGVRTTTQFRDGSALTGVISHPHPMPGSAFGLAAGPRSAIQKMLQAMADSEPVPSSHHGGPYASESELVRKSYLFMHGNYMNTDFWIDKARRGGFGILHYRSPWFTSLGTYEPNRTFFPRGLEDMVWSAETYRKAGLSVSIHTLTGCLEAINSNRVDPLLYPKAPDSLISYATYTLAKPLAPGDKEIFINEKPDHRHRLVHTYQGASNSLQIGGEIIRYSEMSGDEAPYRFGKCERGAFKTEVGTETHPVGTKVKFLRQVYLAFYPEPDSGLDDTIVANIARIHNAIKADMIYFDGSEGMGERYPVDVMRWKGFSALKNGGMSEASTHGHNSWWFHSRIGAWDVPFCDYKAFAQLHVKRNAYIRKSELLEPQMGWWSLNSSSPFGRAQFPDDTEYFAAKAYGDDAAISLGISTTRNQANKRAFEMLTILGWYSNVRLARFFDQETQQRVATPNQDFKLRLEADGKWKFRPVEMKQHRILDVASAKPWEFNNPHGKQPVAFRLEALYSTENDLDKYPVIANFSDESQRNKIETAGNVELELTTVKDDVRGGDAENLRIQAKNSSQNSRGAWARIGKINSYPYVSTGGCRAWGLWVKGDNSGAVLNVQLKVGREFGRSVAEQYIDLDFSGWRFVTLLLREQNGERALELKWPYDVFYNVFHAPLNTNHIGEVNLYLNEIPGNGKVDIQVSSIHLLGLARTRLEDPALTVNGKQIQLPITLGSGEYAEVYPDGYGALFAENCDLIKRFKTHTPAGMPQFDNGKNTLMIGCDQILPEGLIGRVNVVPMTTGETFGTQNPNADWDNMKHEYEIPHIVTGDCGDDAWTFNVRSEKSDDAKLTLEIEPTFTSSYTPAYDGEDSILLDSCAKPEDYALTESNKYSQFVFDSTHQGTSNPGVTFKVAHMESPKSADGGLQFIATSERNDNGGWAAVGYHYPELMDISKYSHLGFWLYGDGKGSQFKVQLRDINKKHHDIYVHTPYVGWRFHAFNIQNAKLDLTKLDYILYYYNGIPGKTTVACAIDGVRAYNLGKMALCEGAEITLNGTKLIANIPLNDDESIRLKDNLWQVYDLSSKVLREGTLPAPLPRPKTGSNHIQIRLLGTLSPSIRYVVNCIKEY